MLVKIIAEGLGLSAILLIICAVGIRNGAVGMIHLYHKDVQNKCVEMGLTTHELIRKRAIITKLCAISVYLIYVLISVYVINSVRGFLFGFLHIFAILSIVNLFDRFVIDILWVEHTNAWTIPGTEELKPYINKRDKILKWTMGTVGFAVFSAILSTMMTIVLK